MRVRCSRLFEAASAVVLSGLLANNAVLEDSARRALLELRASGYSTPSESSPVHVESIDTPGLHAANWSPGTIRLVPTPKSDLSVEHYLRHELMHEAIHRTCRGALPNWANEAAAIVFSGEAATEFGDDVDATMISSFARAARLGAPLSRHHMRTLSALIRVYGWPDKPCAVSPEVERIVKGEIPSHLATKLSYVLMHGVSGRLFEASGSYREALPIGSLLKIPYTASLSSFDALDGKALLLSDTRFLEGRRGALQLDLYSRLLSAGGASVKGSEEVSALLGERRHDGIFPFTFDLLSAARLLRTSLFLEPNRFAVLEKQASEPDATLNGSSDEFKRLLRRLGAGAKTGTVSDERGTPIVGHLTVFWPASAPRMIAVFRKGGVRGAALADDAAPLLHDWSSRYRHASKAVRVTLLTALPKQAWLIEVPAPECHEVARSDGAQMTTCGAWTVRTGVTEARGIRHISGVLRGKVLETDIESYVDSVMKAEGDLLRPVAAAALRAVITANGERGTASRHPDTGTLCDTTHCMVFLGTSEEIDLTIPRPPTTIASAVDYLLENAPNRSWFEFSVGGAEPWSTTITTDRLARLAQESTILDLRRERTRSGEILVRFIYPHGEERVPCDFIMTRLDLPSCPDSITPHSSGYLFSGRGRGHFVGFATERANMLAEKGESVESVLNDAYLGIDSEPGM